MRDAIEAAVDRVNGTPGHAASFDALHDLLEVQAYRLSYWRTASHEINYRRFFDVNTLAGMRVEHPEVFAATHRLLAELLRDGKVHGVRIDHPDGLFDPAGYFEMLQELAAGRGISAGPRSPAPASRPIARSTSSPRKILSGAEPLPSLVGRSRHDRLQLSERPERPLRQSVAGAPHPPRLREAHRPQRSVRRCRVRC